MPDWPFFAGVILSLTVVFVFLARASARAVSDTLDAKENPDAPTPLLARQLASPQAVAGNVLATHGLLIAVIVGTVWYADIPPSALGVIAPESDMVVLGAGLGVALALANAASARLLEWMGLEYDERLRALLAPHTWLGWIGLLLGVLPVVAIAEEFLFRGAIIGGLSAGLGLSTWGLATVSSVLFGLGHGLQGPGGVVVATGLGAVLAVAFVFTGSLTVVVVAHYVVNAAEFALKEGPDPARISR